MRFPIINKQARRRVGIPTLSGGINLRDGIVLCNDNQLTEVKNMWYKDGCLRTRPGTETIGNVSIVAYNEEITSRQTDIFIDGYRLFYCVIVGSRISETDESIKETMFLLQGKETIKNLPTLSGAVSFVAMKNGILYSFMTDGKIYKFDNNATVWELVKEEEYYVPIVYCHCKNKTIDIFKLDFESGETIKNVQSVTFEGTQLEDYNLLGNYYQMVYSTYSEEIETNLMVFNLGCKLPDSTAMADDEQYVIKAEYINKSGEKYTHKAVWKKGNIYSWETDEEAALQGDNLRMYVDGVFNRIVFYTKGTGNYMNIAEETIYIEDNLTITAPCIFSESEKKKIFNMTRCIWFGGYATGLASGTRLFLCGNTETDNKALVCWSGLNDPLYFPEKSCFNVGDTSEAVIAFGKQENTLVIFKEKETWYTMYTRSENIDADDLINQRVLDLQTSSVYFPLTQIHSNIGCKYPDTIQLCRNRLVWLGEDSSIYTLTNQNQYSERNIYCVSDMIGSKLRQESLDGVFSADWEGHYLLFVNNHIYAMDYNSYGYTHIYSYSKSDDAQVNIPWWYWEFDTIENVVSSVLLNNDLYIVFCEKPNSYIGRLYIKKMVNGYSFDDSNTINSVVQTKFFDFGHPNSFKDISSVGLSFGYNEGNEITVSFITDGGEEQDTVLLEEESTERTASFVKSVVLMPAIRTALRLGIRFECQGNMIIDGITMEYRVVGRAR